jgi:hypothetical protein
MVNVFHVRSLFVLLCRKIELPSTAWPCRVQHVRGQLIPSLEIDGVYFQRAINALRALKFGAMMKDYSPSKETNQFSAVLDDMSEADGLDGRHCDPGAVAEHLKKRNIYKNLVDLHPMTKINLLKFEEDGFRIPKHASGENQVQDLVRSVAPCKPQVF